MLARDRGHHERACNSQDFARAWRECLYLFRQDHVSAGRGRLAGALAGVRERDDEPGDEGGHQHESPAQRSLRLILGDERKLTATA